MEDKSVIVVGAGIAGLAAAVELAKAGWIVSLLEGRDRVGGRIHTVWNRDGSAAIELGAEFIHGEHVATWPFIRAAGLATEEVPDRRWRVTGQGLHEDTSLEALDGWEKRVDFTAPDQSLDDFLRHNTGLSDEGKRVLREYVAGFHAADPKEVSVQAVARATIAAQEQEGTRLFRLADGYVKLVDWFQRQFEAAGGRLYSGQVAQRICWRPGQVDVEAWSNGSQTRFTGTAAVITVPLTILAPGSPAELLFIPELREKRAALTGLKMGLVQKVVFELCPTSEFWTVSKPGFIYPGDDGFPTWWAQKRGHLLTGWAGGPRATTLEGNETFVRERAFRAGCRVLRIPEDRVREEVTQVHFHNWTHDPFARGAYSYLRTSALAAPGQLSEPVANTLFFAGEATAAGAQQGTVHGALQSGLRAAESVQRSVR